MWHEHDVLRVLFGKSATKLSYLESWTVEAMDAT